MQWNVGLGATVGEGTFGSRKAAVEQTCGHSTQYSISLLKTHKALLPIYFKLKLGSFETIPEGQRNMVASILMK